MMQRADVKAERFQDSLDPITEILAWRRVRRAVPLLACLLASTFLVQAGETLALRTDADGPTNQKVLRPDGKPLEWFPLVDGEFPPEGSAHAISGELIFVEHPKCGLMLEGYRLRRVVLVYPYTWNFR